jgi:hypothetical protein
MEGGDNRRVNVPSFYGKADAPGRQTTAAGFQQEWRRRKSYNFGIGGVWGVLMSTQDARCVCAVCIALKSHKRCV